MRILPPVLASCLLVHAAVAAPPQPPGCSMPSSIDSRRLTNLTDPLWRPDNPNAGRMVRVDFSGGHYLLTVLGTRLRY